MAITVASQPSADSVSSAYRPVELQATSDDGDIVRMRLEVRFTVPPSASAGGSFDITVEYDPDIGTSNQFTFDIQSLKSKLTGYLAGGQGLPALTGTSLYDKSYGLGKVDSYKFTEVLQQGDGTLADGASTQPIDFFYLLDAIWQHDETQNLNSYIMEDSITGSIGNFLTSAPAIKVQTTENYWIAALLAETPSGAVAFDDSDNTYQLQVETYDSGDSLLQTAKVDFSVPTDRRIDIPCGPNQINSMTLSSGSQTVIDSNVSYYDVALRLIADDISTDRRISEKKRFTVDRKCYNEETRFAFVNRLGGLDWYTFTGRHTEGLEVEKETYKKKLATSHSVEDRGLQTLLVNSQEVFSVATQAEKDNVRRWLKELLEDHMTYKIDGGNYVPVNIEDADITLVDRANNLFRMSISYRHSNEIIRQNG